MKGKHNLRFMYVFCHLCIDFWRAAASHTELVSTSNKWSPEWVETSFCCVTMWELQVKFNFCMTLLITGASLQWGPAGNTVTHCVRVLFVDHQTGFWLSCGLHRLDTRSTLSYVRTDDNQCICTRLLQGPPVIEVKQKQLTKAPWFGDL